LTEDEVNLKVKEWLENHSFRYKGILNKGKGQVPVPDTERQVLIDHMGISDKYPPSQVWVEAKGSDVNFSQLLEGFIRLCYAVYWGGGNGYLAIPHKEYLRLLGQKGFLKSVVDSVDSIGKVGLLDIENGSTLEL